VSVPDDLRGAELACVDLLQGGVGAFKARLRTPVPAVGQQCLALGKPAPGAVEAHAALLVAASVVVPELHRVLDFLLDVGAALTAALPRTGRPRPGRRNTPSPTRDGQSGAIPLRSERTCAAHRRNQSLVASILRCARQPCTWPGADGPSSPYGWVRFFEGCVIAGCSGHAVSPRAGMLSGS